jgi:hypothetical protein
MHNLLYFDPAAQQQYMDAGVPDPRVMYFGARACPLGPVGPDVVSALFYNFNPLTVSSALPRVWDMASPDAFIKARFAAADRCLRPLLGDRLDTPELHEALDLARTAAQAAATRPQGRALFAAHAAIDWPEPPHVQLWWAQTLLREFRGDGHQATLLRAGLTGAEALILYIATEKVDGESLRLTRGWPIATWRATADSLREQGLLTDDEDFCTTERGSRLREWIENTTDLLAAPAYEALGTQGCDRLADLSTALSAPIVAADVIPWLKKRPQVSRRGRVRAATRH